MIMLREEIVNDREAAIDLIFERIHGLNAFVGVRSSPEREYDEAEEIFDSLIATQDGDELENPRLWPIYKTVNA